MKYAILNWYYSQEEPKFDGVTKVNHPNGGEYYTIDLEDVTDFVTKHNLHIQLSPAKHNRSIAGLPTIYISDLGGGFSQR